MKTIGFFGLCKDHNAVREIIKKHCQRTKIDNGEKICYYLRNGHIKAMIMGFVPDVISGQNCHLTTHILTDGVWAWTDDLVYYVEKYNLTIPNDMVAHMQSNSWAVPCVDMKALGKIQYTQSIEDIGIS